jgi:ribose transport system permease protein
MASKATPEQAPASAELGGSPEVTTRRRHGVALALSERGGLIVVWAAMIGFYCLMRPSTFATSATFQTIFGSQTALVFLTLALLCTIIVGEFVDLSVASILGLSATVVPVLTVLHGVNVALASVIAVAIGTVAGAVNGFFVVVVGVNTIVVTLGMSTFLLGIALLIANLGIVSGLSVGYSDIAITSVLGLPIAFYYGLALVLAFAYILVFTPLGRHMEFVGANREVSRLAGVRVKRIRFGAFVVAGFLCGVGGVAVSASLGGFDPADSVSYLLPTVSAVFLGTAVIVPGRFNPIGSLVAVYFLATGVLGLELLGAAGWVSDVFYGAALVIAVSISTLIRGRSV